VGCFYQLDNSSCSHGDPRPPGSARAGTFRSQRKLESGQEQNKPEKCKPAFRIAFRLAFFLILFRAIDLFPLEILRLHVFITPPVRRPVRVEQLSSHWTDINEIGYSGFFENMWRKFKFH
jgi:hypothetical protein